MSKIQINNEIILLRKSVAQAKVQLIKKLTREAQKLRQKKGTEPQKAKNQRKADRLAAEILAVKKVKQDEVTKYILTNNLNLKEVLEDQKSEPLTRMMARIAHHKIFSKKISDFKSKYPHYLEFLGPGRKKKAKLERKEEKLQNKNVENVPPGDEAENIETGEIDNQISSEESDGNESDEAELEEKESTDEKESSHESATEEVENTEESVETTETIETKVKKVIPKSIAVKKPSPSKRKKLREEKVDSFHKIKKMENIDTSKVISDQAIVKKFTEIMEEGTPVKHEEEKEVKKEKKENKFVKTKIQIEKEVDPFFVTEDGESNYLSVVLPKSNLPEKDFDEFGKGKSFAQDNDRFFSKVNRPQRNNQEGNFRNRNSRWEGEKNEKYEKKMKWSEKNVEIAKPKEEEVLHPSWQAKKKQQELLKTGFQGKKIIFDDS